MFFFFIYFSSESSEVVRRQVSKAFGKVNSRLCMVIRCHVKKFKKKLQHHAARLQCKIQSIVTPQMKTTSSPPCLQYIIQGLLHWSCLTGSCSCCTLSFGQRCLIGISVTLKTNNSLFSLHATSMRYNFWCNIVRNSISQGGSSG